MADAVPLTATPGPPAVTASGSRPPIAQTVLPLWIAAISLAVIAVVLIVASVTLVNALHASQASLVQLQQQVGQLKSGLGGLLGG